MDTIQAAILLVKLAVFPEELTARENNARKYTGLLEEAVTTPHVPENFQSAWAQYSILTDQREQIIESLKEEGIPAAIYYPKPLHLQEAFGGLGYKPGNFPVSEDVSRKILSLPMHPYLSPEDIEKIAAAVIRALKQS
jgi:dTDP-4-amino-4,6-dideoxygalactose transaminase